MLRSILRHARAALMFGSALLVSGLVAEGCGSNSSDGTNANADGGESSADGSPNGDDGNASTSDGATCSLPAMGASQKFVLRFDQVGYLTLGTKWAVALSHGEAAPSFQIFDANGCAIGAKTTAGPRVVTATSRAGTMITGDRVDLSAITIPGKYWVQIDGALMGPIMVGDDVYANVLPTLLKFLGEQRCGPTTTAASQHAACHLFASTTNAFSGDGIAVDDGTTGTITKATGTAVDVEGGWHDAGDYIKFVGTTAFVLSVDLLALRDHPKAFQSPQAGATYEALRTEMRWGLDWLLKMIGGTDFYHQVSGDKDHDPDPRPPEADTTTAIPVYTQRPLFKFADGKGANLLGRGAAAFALGSTVFADDATYSATLIAAAKTAYAAAATRAAVQNPDPVDFYEESALHDDLAFGAAEISLATKDATFAQTALTEARNEDTTPTPAKPLYWGDVRALAFLETARAFAAGSAERTEMTTDLTSIATPMLTSATAPTGPGAPYHYALDSFDNGTIEQSLGAAAVCLAARRLGANDACDQVARDQLHWMLGLNPFGYSFMIGLGTTYPKHPQHAWAQATGKEVTGAIVGGPTGMAVLMDVASGDSSLQLPTTTSPLAIWSTDDLVYEDDVTNYVVNEPAIDFTGPLVFVLGELYDPRP